MPNCYKLNWKFMVVNIVYLLKIKYTAVEYGSDLAAFLIFNCTGSLCFIQNFDDVDWWQ